MKIVAGTFQSGFIDDNGVLRGIGREAGLTRLESREDFVPVRDASFDGWGYIFAGDDGGCWKSSIETGAVLTNVTVEREPRERRRRIVGPEGVSAVGLSSAHALAVDSDGRVWSWGHNGTGQLGRDCREDFTPAPIAGLDGVVAVSVSGSIDPRGGYSIALDHDGVMWTWGDGNMGVLGEASRPFTSRGTPQPIRDVPKMVSVSAGYCHAVSIDTTGKLWLWGANYDETLGFRSPAYEGKKRQLVEICDTPTQLDLGTRFVSAAASNCGHNLTYQELWTGAIDETGGLWTWGDGSAGALGTSSRKRQAVPERRETEATFVAIDIGAHHSLALDDQGACWTWGGNTRFAAAGTVLGHGSKKGEFAPKKVVDGV